MNSNIDIIASNDGNNFRLVPISRSAREWISLKFTGTCEVLVTSVEVDAVTLGRVIRFCDAAGYRISMIGGAA